MRFKVSKVQKLVEDSICRSRNLMNPFHGITEDLVIGNLVTPPVSKRFYVRSASDEPRKFRWLWKVWDEVPGSSSGYLIVFDPRSGQYGKATKSVQGETYGCFIGFDGYEFGDALGSL